MKIRTAESVSPKHPDKLCDRISDAILDELLKQDPNSRVAVETVGGHGLVVVTGEITTIASVNYEAVVRRFIPDNHNVTINLVEQSPEIARGVDTGGAGDQGIMVGYACDETDNFMPLEYELARSLNQAVYEQFEYDGKTQVTVDNGNITAIVVSFQHAKKEELNKIVEEWLDGKSASKEVTLHINPAGDWEIGGFESDAGLTGRKLAVDNYGPRVPIGGGAFSGKDPSKVDRSAAYMARKIAVDYLKKHNASEVYCYLGYAIGVAEPVQATVIVDGKEYDAEGYDLSPNGIIKALDLRRPVYSKTAEYGHFGRDFIWC